MKKIVLAFFLIALIVPPVALGVDIRTDSSKLLTSSDEINDDLYLFGSNVINSGVVHGDILAAGNTLLLAGDVDGTVQVAGSDILLTGMVGETVRAAGSTVVIKGDVGRDVLAAGGTVEISGNVGRDVLIGAGVATVNGAVDGDLEINAKKVIIGADAQINGSFTYRSPTEAEIDPSAEIAGEVNYIQTAVPNKDDMRNTAAGFSGFWLITKMLMSLLTLLVFIRFFKKFLTTLTTNAFANPQMEFVRGLLGIIVYPIVAVILCMTIIGLPLGVIGILSYIVLMIVSSIIAPLLLGSLLYKATTKRGHYEISGKVALIGVIAYTLLSLIPIVGFVMKCVFCSIAFGILIKTKWNTVKALG